MNTFVSVFLMLLSVPASLLAMPSIDELPDMTGGVSPLLSHDTLSKKGVQPTWQARIGETHPRECPAASSFSTTLATDLTKWPPRLIFRMHTTSAMSIPRSARTMWRKAIAQSPSPAVGGLAALSSRRDPTTQNGLDATRSIH